MELDRTSIYKHGTLGKGSIKNPKRSRIPEDGEKKTDNAGASPTWEESGLPKIHFNENAIRVLERRYLKKDGEGNVVESPEDMVWRVSRTISKADLLYDPETNVDATAREFYRLLSEKEFIANSPTLMNAGRELGQLSACFVLPVDDSMNSIFEAIKHTALIHKSGGGTGFSFSRIRPKNDVVLSTKGISSGPISFMTVFDAATETIKQGGTRRGANMGILSVDHPDIKDFIKSKGNDNRLNNFNISVGMTEKFMDAMEEGVDYDIVNPRSGKVMGRYSSVEIFDMIVQMAWKNGEPGILFIDRINRDNPTPNAGRIESTNPCGEQPLLPYESCNLGSINLARMVKNGEIDFEKLSETVRISVHFLDNVIDVNRYPLPEIDATTKSNRKIGLGVMGFADMLIDLEIAYDSEEALSTGEEVMEFINQVAKATSVELAEKRTPFPNFTGSIYDVPGGSPMRNATCTTIAPTGTISIIANCSSGIEPLFALSFYRNVMDNDKLPEVAPRFIECAKREGFYSEALMKEVAQQGSVQNVDTVPDKWKRVFVTSHDISPEWHIRMQAAFQRYTDNSVSKTVNLPKNATPDDVSSIYRMAYELDCKGVTIYRDGSRTEQVLNKGEEKKTLGKGADSSKIEPRPRPKVTNGVTMKMETGCGDLYVTINKDNNGLPFEIFNQMGKAGGCASSQSEAIGRLVSLALRSNIDPKKVINQLKGICCHLPRGFGESRVTSCADAVAQALEINLLPNVVKEGASKGAMVQDIIATFMRGACPDCGSSLEPEGGCVVCRACGFSECS
ncbi:vitamin B12-dependent ribonucleotide reductase [Thermodesulfobacteriota bacterium]